MTEDLIAAALCTLALLSHGFLATRGLSWRADSRRFLVTWTGRCRTCFRCSTMRAMCSFPEQARRDDAEVVDEADVWAECLSEEVQLKRHRLTCHGGKIVSKLMFLALAGVCYNALAGHERWMTLLQTILTCVVHQLNCFLDYGNHGARAQGEAIPRFVFATQMFIMGAIMLVGSRDISIVVYTWAVCVPMRFNLSVFMMDANFVSWINASLSAMIGVAAYKSEPMPAELSEVTPGNLMMAEICTLISVAMSSYTCQEMAATSSKLAIESLASKSAAYAALKVLDIRCDIVVQLDGQLRMVDRTAKLAALLLHGPNRVLTGSAFLQYLYSDGESHRFRTWLEAPKGQFDEATGFESKLRDSTGSPIHVELYHVPFETVSGVTYHFIGIRENMVDDSGGARLSSGRVPQESDRTAEAQYVLPPGEDSASLNASEGAIYNNPTTSGVDDPAVQEIDGHPVFQFDAGSFRIIGCSPGFRIGDDALKPGSFLIDRLRKGDVNTEFFNAYADLVASLVSRARASAEPVEDEFASTMLFRPEACREEFRLIGRISICARWLVHTQTSDDLKLPSMTATVIVESAVLEVHGISGNSVASSRPQSECSVSPESSGNAALSL